MEVGNAAALSGEVDVEFLTHLETVDEVASLEQRWTNSWVSPLRSRSAVRLSNVEEADSLPGAAISSRFEYRCSQRSRSVAPAAATFLSSQSRRRSRQGSRSSSSRPTTSLPLLSRYPTHRPRSR